MLRRSESERPFPLRSRFEGGPTGVRAALGPHRPRVHAGRALPRAGHRGSAVALAGTAAGTLARARQPRARRRGAAAAARGPECRRGRGRGRGRGRRRARAGKAGVGRKPVAAPRAPSFVGADDALQALSKLQSRAEGAPASRRAPAGGAPRLSRPLTSESPQRREGRGAARGEARALPAVGLEPGAVGGRRRRCGRRWRRRRRAGGVGAHSPGRRRRGAGVGRGRGGGAARLRACVLGSRGGLRGGGRHQRGRRAVGLAGASQRTLEGVLQRVLARGARRRRRRRRRECRRGRGRGAAGAGVARRAADRHGGRGRGRLLARRGA